MSNRDTDATEADAKPGDGRWWSRFRGGKKAAVSSMEKPAEQITPGTEVAYGLGGTTVASLMGSQRREVRHRDVIYRKWGEMEGDPICSTGISGLVSAALGGHETSAQLVFIEKNEKITSQNKQLERMADEIAGDLTEFFNEAAFQLAYIAAWGGDSYPRIYSKGNKGVTGLHLDECYLPPLVQAYEQAGKTVGFVVYAGEKSHERLSPMQMARMKMPRTQFVPQPTVFEKAQRMNVQEDDRDKAPVIPSLVGGSLLYPCEGPYDDLYATLVGLVGSRISDSIDEEVLGVNLSNMTLDQQNKLLSSITTMLLSSKKRALEAIKTGKPVSEKIRHVIPSNGEKQLYSVTGGNQPRANAITVDDAIFHLRRLSGGMGMDLSLLGFADQMAGGLGEGGFFRTSVRVGENARILRSALSSCFNHVIDVHTCLKYGVVFPQGQRPWVLNYFGTISALEAERQKTRSEAMNTGMGLVQAIAEMKNNGVKPDQAALIFSKIMGLDEDMAKALGEIMAAKPPSDGEGFA